MKNLLFLSLSIALICSIFSCDARAQAISGYTEIDYYAVTDQLDAYSETDLDWDLVGDYSAFVSLSVIDDNSGYPISYDSARDYYDNGFISVERLITGTNPDTTYTALGVHRAYAELWDYFDDYPYGIWYYDDWYFTWFEGQTISDPWWHSFFSPGWTYFRRRARAITLGTTFDSDSVTTPHGPPDHLQIIKDSIFMTSSSSCSDYVERDITYKIVDANDHGVGSAATYIRENESSVVDTCDNQRPAATLSCIPKPGSFIDYLTAACPEFGDFDCGYDIPDEQWLWCSDSGLSPLAKFDYNIRHDRIIVSGYSGQLPLKWFVRADGSIQRR